MSDATPDETEAAARAVLDEIAALQQRLRALEVGSRRRTTRRRRRVVTIASLSHARDRAVRCHVSWAATAPGPYHFGNLSVSGSIAKVDVVDKLGTRVGVQTLSGYAPDPTTASTTVAPTTAAPRTTTTRTTAPPTTTTRTTAPLTTTTRTTAAPVTTTTRTTVPTGTKPLGVAGSWTLRFSDEFSGSALDTSKWATTSLAESDGHQGNPNNQQLEWNQGSNCSVGNGALTITAKPDNITSASGHHYNWSSCLITSAPSYSFTYGYVEERAQFPVKKGFWPGFWTFGALGTNVGAQETDVYEYFSDNHTRLYLISHATGGGSCIMSLPFDPAAGMHTYGADIQASGTTWYVDGVKACTAPGHPTQPANIISNMFVYSGNGNGNLQPVAGTVERKTVDYIRAWQH